MFLLIRNEPKVTAVAPETLHSTMFLLIRPFTFLPAVLLIPLHSTMFLLILSRNFLNFRKFLTFTFHYVSINTDHRPTDTDGHRTFTFHYVSINTAD